MVIQINHPATSNVHYKAIKVSKQSVVTIPESGGGGSGSGGATKGLWKEDGESLKPCWNNPSPSKFLDRCEDDFLLSANFYVQKHRTQHKTLITPLARGGSFCQKSMS